MTGAGAVGNKFLTDSWKLLQLAANTLAASERYQGAEYAGDATSQALQNAAFEKALSAYHDQEKTVATDLKTYILELQSSVSDIDLSTDASLSNLKAYLIGLSDPLSNDPFLHGFISSIKATVPALGSTIVGDVQTSLSALQNASSPSLSGSAFSALSVDADRLGGTISVAIIQADHLGIARSALPIDYATHVVDEINAGRTTEASYIDSLLSQASVAAIPSLIVSNFINGVTPTSSKLDLLADFSQAQFNSYSAAGVADPSIGPYEALGLGLSDTAQFSNKFGNLTDDALITNCYQDAFGRAPTAGQIAHFEDQIVYFETLYESVGVGSDIAALHAHGAVVGQILGFAAAEAGNHYADLAQEFLKDAAIGIAKYGSSLFDNHLT